MINGAAEKSASKDNAPATLPTTPAADHGSHRNHMQQFKAYLRRNLLYMERLVQGTDQLLADEVRMQTLHTLSYALGERELWPLVRTLLLAVAPKMELGGHREDWLPYLQQGLAQSKVMGDLATAAECHLQSGLIYRLLSDFVCAREQLTTSIALAAQAGESRNQARALNELAWLEQLQEEYAMAEAYVAQALVLLGNDDPERAVCYRVLGMIAIGYKDWQNAEALHRQALKIFEQQGDLRRKAWSLHNLAYVQHGQSHYKEAIELYHQAAVSLEKLKDISHWSIVQTNLGLTYYQAGMLDAAIQCYQEAYSIAKKLHDNLQLARILTNFGLIYLALLDYTKAEESFYQSAQTYDMLGNKRSSLNAVDGIAMVYLAQHRYKQAIALLERALKILPDIKDSPDYYYLHSSLNEHLQQAKSQVDSTE